MSTFVPRFLAQLLNEDMTPDKAYYEGVKPEDRARIETVLDANNVQTSQGFNYWQFIGTEDGRIMARRLKGEWPRVTRGIEEVVKLLKTHYKHNPIRD
jgi:hypothetical protein